MTRYLRNWNILITLSLLTSCASDTSSPEHSFRIYEEDGVTIAETAGGPKFEGELFEYIEVVRLNQDDSVPESLLGMPSPYFMDEEGSFYVPDLRPPRVVCFDAEGQYSHTIGREGEGPGEYRSVEITRIRGDELTVFDGRTRRATRFHTDGTLVSTLTTRYQKSGPAPAYSLNGLQGDEHGRMITYWSVRNREDIYQMSGAAVDVLDSEGEVLFEIETPMIRIMYEINSGGIVAGVGLSFSGSPVIWRLDDGRFIQTTGEAPEIDVFSSEGDLTGRIVIDLPLESTAQAEAELRAYYAERIRNATNPHSRSLSQAMLEDFQIPEYKAFWSDMEIDESGYIWLRHSEQFYGTVADSISWRVLSPDGEYLGETRCQATEAGLSYGHLLTIHENEETGAQDLIVYCIVPAVPGLRYP